MVAACCLPVFNRTVSDTEDRGLLAYTALVLWKLPPYLVVVTAAFGVLPVSQFA
jgi:hypothetical protein